MDLPFHAFQLNSPTQDTKNHEDLIQQQQYREKKKKKLSLPEYTQRAALAAAPELFHPVRWEICKFSSSIPSALYTLLLQFSSVDILHFTPHNIAEAHN